MKLVTPTLVLAAVLFAMTPDGEAQQSEASASSSRVLVEVPLPDEQTSGATSPLACAESVLDQGTDRCIQASSTATFGLLFPYPGIGNGFVAPAFVGGGQGNQATGAYSFVAGGKNNTASGDYAAIGGGRDNVASGSGYSFAPATVAGGRRNQATGYGATIGGGSGNYAQGHDAVIGGGVSNLATGTKSTIGGGNRNVAYGFGATIGGGGDVFGLGGNTAGFFGTVGGGSHNWATGRYSSISGGGRNRASGIESTVGGGDNNRSTGFGTVVAGGSSNIASGSFATVGGGARNKAYGNRSTVPGGYRNRASGAFSFAAGRRAKANHDGAFVWGDRFNVDKPSSAPDEFNVYASGGVRMFTNSVATTGAALAPGSGTWSMLSDRDAKENVEPVDTQTVLEGVVAMPLSTWNYTEQNDSIRHMGPMAQDFNAAFGLGVSDKLIDAVDSDGVALAAIQGLNAKLREEMEMLRAEKDDEIAALEQRLERLEALAMAR